VYPSDPVHITIWLTTPTVAVQAHHSRSGTPSANGHSAFTTRLSSRPKLFAHAKGEAERPQLPFQPSHIRICAQFQTAAERRSPDIFDLLELQGRLDG
jgi:hypothetical protein